MPQVLESLHEVADEIIVVDTGSTDKTVEICELFGAKVFHSPWRDDFSFHRNEAFSYASGEWWLVVDADEKIVKAPGYTKKAFHEWLDSITADYSAVALDVKDIQNGNVAMNCNSARMFRKGSVHYRRRVHNQPMFQSPAVMCHFIGLEHYGYDLSSEDMEAKFERTNTLLMKELEENPDDYDVYFYLCQLYGHHGREEESREWGLKYLALKDKMPESKFNNTIYFTLIKNYQETGAYEEAYKLIREALVDRPNDPDICSALCDHGAMTNNHPIMAEGARRFLKGYQEFQENPAKKAGQFYFSMKPEVATLNLYRLCVTSLEEGMKAWSFLKPRLKDVRNQAMLQELKANFNIIGLPHLITESPELTEQEFKTVMDVRQVAV